MTSSNQIPPCDTSAIPQASKPTDSLTIEDAEALVNTCNGQPATLELHQMDEFDKWLNDSRAGRRVSLAVLSKPFDELESGILNDRDLAVAMADVQRCSADVEHGLDLMLKLVRQSRLWVAAALSSRPDCEEIMAEVDDNEENENAAQSHCSSVDDSDKNASEKGTYETVMTERIKAIQPKFKALYDKYIFPGGSELLTDPKGVRKETKNLRHEINELQNKMPVESEEAMDCRLAIDHLDFLIRLIDSKFDFRNSDLIALSLVVDQASDVFSQSLSWLTPDNGGDLVKDNLH